MRNTRDLLDALRARAGSDRKAAALVGVSQPTVNRWRQGYARPDDDSAGRIAAALQLDHAFVLALIHAERAETAGTRATWTRIAAQFGKAAAVGLVAVGIGAPSPAPTQGAPVPPLCIMSTRRRPSAAAAFAALAARTLGITQHQLEP